MEGGKTMFKVFQEMKPIKWVYANRELIDFDPPYQRLGRLWKKRQKQLLIDSIINDFDLPKFYFQFMPPQTGDKLYSYAIIDGKQRIETILDFIDGQFPLAESFHFFDSSLAEDYDNIAGKYFEEIEEIAPAITARFWQYGLTIVLMDTTDPDIVNEMFIRLNSGIQVNTAEKRNAIGGELSRSIHQICTESPFFRETINANSPRFQHHDLAIKLLMLQAGITDLSKSSVDDYVMSNRELSISCQRCIGLLISKLEDLSYLFMVKDPLLKKKNIIISLYSVIDQIPQSSVRDFLEFFERKRKEASEASKNNLPCDPALVEFNRLLQQGADKHRSIELRRSIMLQYLEVFLSK